MWKKSDQPYAQTPVSSNTSGERVVVPSGAVIGPSITIKGELYGDEDLIIEGTVDGTVNLKQNRVTVGKNGKINADIYAKMIQIEGHVRGDLQAEQQVIIRKSGYVTGNVKAPQVALEEGCRFKGSIDMEGVTETATAKSKAAKSGDADGKQSKKTEESAAL